MGLIGAVDTQLRVASDGGGVVLRRKRPIMQKPGLAGRRAFCGSRVASMKRSHTETAAKVPRFLLRDTLAVLSLYSLAT